MKVQSAHKLLRINRTFRAIFLSRLLASVLWEFRNAGVLYDFLRGLVDFHGSEVLTSIKKFGFRVANFDRETIEGVRFLSRLINPEIRTARMLGVPRIGFQMPNLSFFRFEVSEFSDCWCFAVKGSPGTEHHDPSRKCGKCHKMEQGLLGLRIPHARIDRGPSCLDGEKIARIIMGKSADTSEF